MTHYNTEFFDGPTKDAVRAQENMQRILAERAAKKENDKDQKKPYHVMEDKNPQD